APASWPGAGTNTTLVVVATDAPLDRDRLQRVAQVAQTGLARVVAPVHTLLDGDVAFALATGRRRGEPGPADVLAIADAAAELVERAALRAVRTAEPLAGVPRATPGDGTPVTGRE